MGIVEGISAVKTGFQLAKSIGELARKGEIDGNEVATRLIALQSYMLDSQSALNEAWEEQRKMAEQITALEAKLNFQATMKFEEPLCWQDGDQTPYCPSCWETKRDAIHVVMHWSNRERTRWDCPTCKNSYLVEHGPGRRPAQREG